MLPLPPLHHFLFTGDKRKASISDSFSSVVSRRPLTAALYCGRLHRERSALDPARVERVAVEALLASLLWPTLLLLHLLVAVVAVAEVVKVEVDILGLCCWR